MDLCMLGKFQPGQPVYYLQLWNEATSSGSVGASFHFSLTWLLQFSPPLLPFVLVFKELLCFRCLRAMWTTARTQITPGWRKPSSISTWTEEVRWSRKLKTWCVDITSFHWWFSKTEFSFRLFDLLLFNTTGGEQAQRSPVAGAEWQEQPHVGPSGLSQMGCQETQQEVLMPAVCCCC